MTKKDFFKKFGQIALDVVKAEIPAITAVEAAVKDAKSGKDKKKAVMDVVTATPSVIESIKGEDIMNQDLFTVGVGKVNDGMVDIMNSLKKPTE